METRPNMPALVSAKAEKPQVFQITFQNHREDKEVWHTEATVEELAQGWLENGERKEREEREQRLRQRQREQMVTETRNRNWLMLVCMEQYTGSTAKLTYREVYGDGRNITDVVPVWEMAQAWLREEERRLMEFRARTKTEN